MLTFVNKYIITLAGFAPSSQKNGFMAKAYEMLLIKVNKRVSKPS